MKVRITQKKKNCNNIEHIITTEKKGDHRPSAEHV